MQKAAADLVKFGRFLQIYCGNKILALIALPLARGKVYAAADAVLTVSQKEAELLRDFTATTLRTEVVPVCEDMEPSPLPRTERAGILLLGGTAANLIQHNRTFGNGRVDLSGNCLNQNVWQLNLFGTADQTCIH